MSLRVSSPAASPSGFAHPGDGQRLAASLRTCRLTTLYGAAGSGKSTLLRNDVLPMLHRRATDVAFGGHGAAPRVVIPFADRRRGPASSGGARTAEIAVLFDDWWLAPLPRLLIQVHEAMGLETPAVIHSGSLSLAGSLAALNMQFGARFLIILDQFDRCLAAAPEEPAVREFLDQLVQTLNRPLLAANFLIAVRDESTALLDGLRAHVPGFDDHTMQLGAPPEARVPLRQVPPSGGAPDAAAADPLAASDDTTSPTDGPERTPAAADDEWFQSIGAVVQRAAEAARRGSIPPPAEAAVLAPASPASPTVAAAQVPPVVPPPAVNWMDEGREAPASDEQAAAGPLASANSELPWTRFAAPEERVDTLREEDAPVPRRPLAPVPPRKAALPRKTELAVWVTAGAVFIGYGAWVALSPRSEPTELAATEPSRLPPPVVEPAPAPASPAPAPLAPASPAPAPLAPTLSARLPAGLDATPRPLTELAGTLALALPPSTHAAPAEGWPAGFVAVPGAPQFAVARYDALQAARRGGVATPLQVLAPLYLDPVYFVARADSPLTQIHDIGDAAIEAGPAGSSRAVTAGGIYQRLFDKPLPSRATAAASADAAVDRLLRGDGVDVVVLAGSQPSAWLASLPPATAKAVKLLALDRNHPADQRALQAYLPTTLRAGSAAGTPSLAVMSFLVTAEPQAGVAGVKALCAALPALQQTGDPMWRALQPGLQLAAGWPASPAAQQAWHDCAPRSG